MHIGIDLGTSSVRVALVRRDGSIAGLGQQEYPIHADRPGHAEQAPEEWWWATCAASRQALAAAGVPAVEVRGIGFSGQMHGLVPVDVEGRAAARAIIWADSRSAKQAARLTAEIRARSLEGVAGNRVAPGFMAATLAWARETGSPWLERSRWYLLPKDYLRIRMGGEVCAEPSDASSTLLLDVARGQWSPELAALAGCDVASLPPLQPSVAIVGQLSATAAEDMGLAEGTPLVAGAADQAAQAVGNGVMAAGRASVTIGTGGQVLQPSLTPRPDPQLRLHAFCHAVPDTWYLMAATLSAGLSLRWWRGILDAAQSYDELGDAAASVAPGADGLLYLPHLLGERTPHMDAAARGALAGLRLTHTQAHLTRAVMEGVAFSLRAGMGLMAELVPAPAELVASGGAARSRTWMQIQADVFGRPLRTVQGEERAVVGAAVLAGVGTGAYGDLAQAAEATVRYGEAVEPAPQHVRLYDELFAIYEGLYPALHQTSQCLSAWAEGRTEATSGP